MIKRLFFAIFVFVGLIFLVCNVKSENNKPLRQKEKGEFVIATWNLGHFALGNKANSIINLKDYESERRKYRDFVNEIINPDIICINEYSEDFIKNSKVYKSDTVLFDRFKSRSVFEQRFYSCNAIFSNLKIRKVKANDFISSQQYLANNPKANQYYYISAKLTVDGKKIDLVCTHLYPWNGEIRDKQIAELIEKYKDKERVIVCGDLNTSNFKAFTESGFNVANGGKIVTYPASKRALDNIITKGLQIREVQAVKTDLSDHYPLVCILSFK